MYHGDDDGVDQMDKVGVLLMSDVKPFCQFGDRRVVKAVSGLGIFVSVAVAENFKGRAGTVVNVLVSCMAFDLARPNSPEVLVVNASEDEVPKITINLQSPMLP